MKKSSEEETLIAALEREASSHGIDVVDVEVVGTSKAPTVRIRLDHADEGLGPISLDEVTAQNAWVADAVENAAVFAGAYTLEVSSPGLDRPLRRESDFRRFSGEEVNLVTTATEGRRRYTGTLVGIREGSVVLTCDKEECVIPLDQVKSCKIHPTIDFSGKSGKREEK